MVQPRLVRAMAGRIDLLLICSAWPDVSQGNIPLYGVRGWLGRQPVARPQQLAAALGVPVVYCNTVGAFATRVPGLGLTYRSEFAGSSSINDAHGRITAAAGREETVLVGEVRVGRQSPLMAVA
jgi:predicted amidohydrolase